MLLIPFSTAALPDIQFDQASLLGVSSSEGEFAGLYTEFPSNGLALTVSGELSISTEFVNRNRVVAIGLPTAEGHEPPVAFEGSSTVSIDNSGEIFLGVKNGQATLATTKASLVHEAIGQTWDKELAQEPTSPTIPSKNTLKLTSTDAGAFRVQGDFTFSLWNAELETADGTHWAGQRTDEVASGTSIGSERSQLLHVTITNGTLEGNFAGANVETYWKTAALQGEGELLIPSATNLAGINIGNIRLEDDWSLNVEGGETLTATGLQASAGNIAGTSIQPDTMSLLWWLLAAPFVILAALIVRPPPRVIVKRMERDLEAGKYLQVAGY